jgi:hypothetical protein
MVFAVKNRKSLSRRALTCSVARIFQARFSWQLSRHRIVACVNTVIDTAYVTRIALTKYRYFFRLESVYRKTARA